jgi:hypothetical protein
MKPGALFRFSPEGAPGFPEWMEGAHSTIDLAESVNRGNLVPEAGKEMVGARGFEPLMFHSIFLKSQPFKVGKVGKNCLT